MISYGKQSVNTNDINAVTKALKKSLITQGDTINHFEKLLSKKLKANYCTVVSNGTAALNITANALEWSKKDIIITRGEKGAISINHDKIIEINARSNLKIKDLTGAGDLFAAGYLHGIINNLDTKECLLKGTELSSKIIQKIGARI